MPQTGEMAVFPLYPDGGYDEIELWRGLEGREARFRRGTSHGVTLARTSEEDVGVTES